MIPDFGPSTEPASGQEPPAVQALRRAFAAVMFVKLSEMLGRMLRKRSIATLKVGEWLLQLRVLRFSFLQDGDVGVGAFPER